MCFGGGIASPTAAARTATGAAPTLDPDLQQAYQRAGRTNSPRAPYSPAQAQAQQQIIAEQQRRDGLREAYAKAEQAANSQLSQIAEQQRQAEAARVAEGERQAQLRRDVEQARVAQEQQIGRERLATQAASASMQVLRAQRGGAQAPSAQMSRRQGGQRNPRQTSAQSLRIGASATSPGVGLNIGG